MVLADPRLLIHWLGNIPLTFIWYKVLIHLAETYHICLFTLSFPKLARQYLGAMLSKYLHSNWQQWKRVLLPDSSNSCININTCSVWFMFVSRPVRIFRKPIATILTISMNVGSKLPLIRKDCNGLFTKMFSYKNQGPELGIILFLLL